MSKKTLGYIKTIGWILVTIALLQSGVSCSKETPDSKKRVEQKAQNRASPKQEEEVSQVTVSKIDKREGLVSTGKEIKVEPNDVEISRSAQILLWRLGAKKELDGTEPWGTKLQHDCETLFISADDILKEAVTKWTLERVRAGEAIELLYRKEQHFKVRAGTKSMHVDGLLIPLKPLHGNTAVIYHRLGSYSAGPLINTQGKKITDQLTETLKKHGLIDK